MKENILEKNDCIMYELLYFDFVVFHVVCWVFDVVQIFFNTVLYYTIYHNSSL